MILRDFVSQISLSSIQSHYTGSLVVGHMAIKKEPITSIPSPTNFHGIARNLVLRK